MRIYFLFIVLNVNGKNSNRIETLVSLVRYRNVLSIETAHQIIDGGTPPEFLNRFVAMSLVTCIQAGNTGESRARVREYYCTLYNSAIS